MAGSRVRMHLVIPGAGWDGPAAVQVRNLMHRLDTMGSYRVLTQYGSMAEGIRKISAVGQRSRGGPVRQSFSTVNHPIVRYRGRFGIGCEQADFPPTKWWTRFLNGTQGRQTLGDERNITSTWRGMVFGVVLGLLAWAAVYFLVRWLLS